MLYTERLESFNKRSDYIQEGKQLFERMKPALNGPVLDVGCGVGSMMAILRDSGVNMYGIDPAGQNIAKLTKEKVAQADGQALPFQDNKFSAVYYMHSIAHIPGALASLHEARRVLKPGADIFIVTPNVHFETLVKPVKSLIEMSG